jgi:hypothetical protein
MTKSLILLGEIALACVVHFSKKKNLYLDSGTIVAVAVFCTPSVSKYLLPEVFHF